jgi:hypothetical protein
LSILLRCDHARGKRAFHLVGGRVILKKGITIAPRQLSKKATAPFFPATHARTPVQPKLTVNAPDDASEKEADQVADSVIRKPTAAKTPFEHIPPVSHAISPLRRKCVGCAEEEKLQDKQEPEETVQRKDVPGAVTPATPPSFDARLHGASGSGSSLPDNTKGEMESRFGMGFQNVRLHTDATAGDLAHSIQAQAFTHGSDIYFGRNKFSPGTNDGKKLLAHELTHVVQQESGGSPGRIQRDLAIEPPLPNAVGRVLTAPQIQAAIAFNVTQFPDPAEIALIRGIIGLPRDPAVIDADFVNMVALYQVQYGETSDGRVGRMTMTRLAREIRAEGESLTARGAQRGALDIAFVLQEQLDGFIAAANTTYADYRDAIRAATILNRTVALIDPPFMRRLRDALPWNSFARSAELLGRFIPDANALLRDGTVRAALAAAWAASNAAVTIWAVHNPARVGNPCNPPPAGGPAVAAHEEGGWVYLNLITGAITIRRAAVGGQAGINLNAPPAVADSVIVADFHTHPNVGPCWGTAANPVFASAADTALANGRGVPGLIRGAFPAVANTHDVFAGPGARQHLAGNRLYPGAAGGLAPQADIFGRERAFEQ